MRQPCVDDRVRLIHDVPHLSLPRGAVGVVRSVWFAPSPAYEVEFHQHGRDFQAGCRCLLHPEQLDLAEPGDDHAHDRDAVTHADHESFVAGVP